MGLRTLNEPSNQIEPLLHQMREQPIANVPTVVQLDGIWVTIQKQGEKSQQDKGKRRRKQRTGKKRVILVARGFWEDGTREILAWQVAPSEEHTQWETWFSRLWKRGVPPEKGLKLVVRDGSAG